MDFVNTEVAAQTGVLTDGCPPGFEAAAWSAYLLQVQADMEGLSESGRMGYQTALQTAQVRYLMLQVDQVRTWQKVQTLADCGILAVLLFGLVILGIQLKHPL